MGAWSFVRQRMARELPNVAAIRYLGRARSASPATGSYSRHVAVQEELARRALEGPYEGGDVELDAASPAAATAD